MQRFWTKVERRGPDDCWLWTARRNRNGYGTFWLGRSGVLATHVALTLSGKPRPEGLIALHSCDNPPCVNPNHLRWGTRKENQSEMSERERTMAQRKTHCKNGHPFDAANTRLQISHDRAPSRRCRACEANATSRYKKRRIADDAPKPSHPSEEA
jgi:hypothetical protein